MLKLSFHGGKGEVEGGGGCDDSGGELGDAPAPLHEEDNQIDLALYFIIQP